MALRRVLVGCMQDDLPMLQFGKGSRKYIVTEADAKAKAVELGCRIRTERKRLANRQSDRKIVLGCDTEWLVTYQKGQPPRKVALLQLCFLQAGGFLACVRLCRCRCLCLCLCLCRCLCLCLCCECLNAQARAHAHTQRRARTRSIA